MLEQYLPWIPYELIGQIVVALVLLMLAIVILLTSVFILLTSWRRGWVWISNRMYHGYDIDQTDERPPLWKVRIAGVTLAIARFKFKKIIPAYKEAEEITDDDTTFVQYLSEVFVDSSDD